MSELRWHPFLQTWVITATHRQERPHLPPPEYCPLCPTLPGAYPTEVPADHYEIVVFQNKFPSLRPDPAPPDVDGTDLYPVAPARGECEVVLYFRGPLRRLGPGERLPLAKPGRSVGGSVSRAGRPAGH